MSVYSSYFRSLFAAFLMQYVFLIDLICYDAKVSCYKYSNQSEELRNLCERKPLLCFLSFCQALYRALWSIAMGSKMVRVSYFRTQNQTKRKTLSKLSMIGFNGAGILFHRRADRLKVRSPSSAAE